MLIFGFTTLILNLFCLAFGASAKDISALFALGAQGIPVSVSFQFLGVSALPTGARYVFLLPWAVVFRKLAFCDNQGKDGKQAYGGSITASEGNGGKKETNVCIKVDWLTV